MSGFGAIFLSLTVAMAAADPKDAAQTRVPVLVELFTSQGCSSCPPADAVLSRLDGEQPVRGAEIIVLSEHVDYWNRLGWTDPFSSYQFSERQQQYGARFSARGVYTPQMIVNGNAELIGSDERRAKREVERAASAAPQVALTLRMASLERDGTLTLALETKGRPKSAEIWLAITESGLSSDVRSGENGGRRLSHTGVVRRLAVVDKEGKVKTSLQPSWKRDSLRAVVFVQDRSSRAILGAASIALGGAPVANGF